MSSGGAPMNAAALPLPRVMPGTGHFGWDCLSGGRRLKVKAVTGANSWQLVARIERSEILVRPVPDWLLWYNNTSALVADFGKTN